MNEYLEIYEKHKKEKEKSKDPLILYDAELRYKCARQYAWAIPDEKAIQILVEHSPIVEIGAGAGYWAAIVTKAGGDILAYDYAPIPENTYVTSDEFFGVEIGSWEMAEIHSDRTLFLCWPPYNEPMAMESLSYYTGNTVIYVGEGYGGCTGDDAFHEELYKNWELKATHNIPQWYGVHDKLSVWERKITGNQITNK